MNKEVLMSADHIDMMLESILKENKEPILIVTLVTIDGASKQICGIFHVWNYEDGELYLKNDGVLYKPLHSFEIIDVKEVVLSELIKNQNILFGLFEEVFKAKENLRKK